MTQPTQTISRKVLSRPSRGKICRTVLYPCHISCLTDSLSSLHRPVSPIRLWHLLVQPCVHPAAVLQLTGVTARCGSGSGSGAGSGRGAGSGSGSGLGSRFCCVHPAAVLQLTGTTFLCGSGTGLGRGAGMGSGSGLRFCCVQPAAVLQLTGATGRPGSASGSGLGSRFCCVQPAAVLQFTGTTGRPGSRASLLGEGRVSLWRTWVMGSQRDRRCGGWMDGKGARSKSGTLTSVGR